MGSRNYNLQLLELIPLILYWAYLIRIMSMQQAIAPCSEVSLSVVSKLTSHREHKKMVLTSDNHLFPSWV